MSKAVKIRLESAEPSTAAQSNQLLDSPAVLIQYPQGAPQLLKGSAHKIQLYKNIEPRKSHQRILVNETETAIYTAKNYAEHNYRNNVQQYIVGVFNDQSNVIKLYDTAHLYSATQYIKDDNGDIMNHDRLNNVKTENDDMDETPRTYEQTREDLISTYGSKKRRRDLRSAATNKVTMQQSITDVLNTTLSHAHAVKAENADENTVNDPTASVSTVLQGTLLPPHNSTTDQASDIYDMYNIISVSAWEQLDSKQLIERRNNTQDILSAFVQHRCTLLSALEHDAKQQKIKSKLLLYIDKLIKFIQLPAKRKQSGMHDRRLNIPFSVQHQLLNDFCHSHQTADANGITHTEYQYNAQMKNKSYCWLCVLCCIAADTILLENDIITLAADLKLTLPSLLQYFKEVGCTIANKTKIQLTAPFTLPQLKGKRQARR